MGQLSVWGWQMLMHKNAVKRVIVCFLLSLLAIGQTHADGTVDPDPNYYSFSPMSIMSLGMGFSPNDVSQAKVRCIASGGGPLDPGALTTALSTILVTNSVQLSSALSLDAKINASYLTFSGGASFSYSEKSLFSENSATVVVSASTEYGRRALTPPIKLTPEAEQIVGDGKHFADVCGTRFVAIERRGASVFAIINISNIDTADVTDMKTNMQASGGWGPLSGGASAAFERALSRAAQTGQLSVQIVATGGVGLSGLGDQVIAIASASSQPQALNNIAAALSTFLKQFNIDNSAPIGFYVASMSDFGWKPNSVDIWNERHERDLRNIVAEYRKTSDIFDQAEGIIQNTDPLSNILDLKTINSIKSETGIIQNYMDKLADIFKKCKSNEDCNLPPQPYPDNIVPSLPLPPDGRLLVSVDGQLLDQVQSDAILSLPGFIIDNTRQIYPSAKDARAVLHITGNYIDAVQVGLKYDGAITPAGDKSAPFSEDHKVGLLNSSDLVYLICDDSRKDNLLGLPCPLGGDDGSQNQGVFALPVGDDIWNTIVELSKKGSFDLNIALYVLVSDKLGRSITVDLLGYHYGPNGQATYWLGGLSPERAQFAASIESMRGSKFKALGKKVVETNGHPK